MTHTTAQDQPLSFRRDAPRVRRVPASRLRRRIVRVVFCLAVSATTLGLLAGAAAERGEGVAARGGRPLSIPVLAAYPYYLQSDPSWAPVTLGSSETTMGGQGCAVCCAAMGLTGLGHPVNPLELCATLGRDGGFTDEGLLDWDAIGRVTQGAVRVEAPRLSHDLIDTELSEGRAVIAHIMLDGTYPHWVLIVGKDGLDYLASDPLSQSGRIVRLSELAPAIRAIRVFRRG